MSFRNITRPPHFIREFHWSTLIIIPSVEVMLKTWIGWNRRSSNSWWTLGTSTVWTIRETGTNSCYLCWYCRTTSICVQKNFIMFASFLLWTSILLSPVRYLFNDFNRLSQNQKPWARFSLVNYEINPCVHNSMIWAGLYLCTIFTISFYGWKHFTGNLEIYVCNSS